MTISALIFPCCSAKERKSIRTSRAWFAEITELSVLIWLVNQHLSVGLWQSAWLPVAPAARVAGFARDPCRKSFRETSCRGKISRDDPHTSPSNGYLRKSTYQSRNKAWPGKPLRICPAGLRERKALSSTQGTLLGRDPLHWCFSAGFAGGPVYATKLDFIQR